MNSEVSGGKTHRKQMVTGRKDIFGLFVHTFESATYTKILLTIGSLNHVEMGGEIYFGTGGRQYVSLQQEKDGGAVIVD
jgi:hypothetical protein